LNTLNEDHADIFSGNRQYERRLTVWVYYKEDRQWFECMLMKYTKKGENNMGIQIKWIEADTTSEYSSEQMELAIRFDEPTDEEKQMYSALKRKVKMLGNRKKPKIRPTAVHEAPPSVSEVDEAEMKKQKSKKVKKDKKKSKKIGKKKGKKKTNSKDGKSKKRKRDQGIQKKKRGNSQSCVWFDRSVQERGEVPSTDHD
jgi:hypothetical protein